MGNGPANRKQEADSKGWRGLLAALSSGAAAIWIGIDQLRTPGVCQGGRRFVGSLSEQLCMSIGTTGTGALYIVVGVVALFAALLWQRHGA